MSVKWQVIALILGLMAVGGCASDELYSPCPSFGRHCGTQHF